MFSDNRWILAPLLAALFACSHEQDATPDASDAAPPGPVAAIDPGHWPRQSPVMVRDPAMEERIAEFLGRMTLEEKVGQVIQADINSVTPDEVREVHLGSVLNGGGSAPGGDNRATPGRWLALADAFYDASTDTSDGGVGIPVFWGTDAVHGHSNVLGATLFPHNIGLGMANDPDLMADIGRVTALEILATGLDWTFAPTIAVARNDRWGRTYESYSEDPRIVAAYAPRIIEGIQGAYGTDEFLDDDHIIATAKHFAGDGGTTDGHDQGDTAIPEAEFRDVQAAGYPPAIRAGVQAVMASYNSYHGRKMHGYKEMLTDVLVGRMGFDGFVVGDWNGHGQVAGCTNTSCAAAFNAGVDLFMAADSWRGLFANTLEQVHSGTISMQRLDQAVSRILRVKMRMGLLDAGRPSSRKHAGDFALLGAPAHRAVARKAVRESLVLLKNEGGLLPLAPDLDVLVAGDGANDIGKQSGGWTLNWQGTGNRREHFPNGTSIFEGLEEALTAGGGSATLSVDGSYEQPPAVAIVVFGEDPYAEGVGDRPHVDYDSDDGLELLGRFHAAGIPTVAILISGRPLWVNPEINVSDAFVAAWLPGSEGPGIADVLVGNPDGSPRFDFTGRLSFSWPRTADQTTVNVGDADYDPLFGYGYGLDYGDDVSVGPLPLDPGISMGAGGDEASLVRFGDAAGDWRLVLRDAEGDFVLDDTRGASATGALRVEPADHEVQEDTMILRWSGPASLVVAGAAADLWDESGGGMAIEMAYQVLDADSDEIRISVDGTALDFTDTIGGAAGRGWQRTLIGLSCFHERGADLAGVEEPLAITSAGPLTLQLSSARIVATASDAGCG